MGLRPRAADRELRQPRARPRRPALPGLGPRRRGGRGGGADRGRDGARRGRGDARGRGRELGHRGRDSGDDAARPGRGLPGRPPGRRRRPGGILAFEQGLTDDFNSPWNRFKRFVADHAFLVCLGIAAVAWLVLFGLMALARERRARPRAPARAARRRHARRSPTPSPTRAPTAPTPCSPPCSTWSTAATTRPARRPPRTRSSTSRSSRRPTAPPSDSTDYEQEVLAFFDQLLDGKRVAMSEMKDEIPAHSEIWRGRWERMTEKLNEVEEGQLTWDRNLNWARWLTVLVAVRRSGSRPARAGRGRGLVLRRDGLVRGLGRHAARSPATRFKRVDAGARRAHRALAGVRALDRGLPAPLRRPAGDARAVEADPRLRGRVRHRRADDRLGPDPRPGGRRRLRRHHWSSYAFVGGFNGSASTAPTSAPASPPRWRPPRARRVGRRGRLLGRRWRRLLGRRGRRLLVEPPPAGAPRPSR